MKVFPIDGWIRLRCAAVSPPHILFFFICEILFHVTFFCSLLQTQGELFRASPQATQRRVPVQLLPCLRAARPSFPVSSRAKPQVICLSSATLSSPWAIHLGVLLRILPCSQAVRLKSPVSSRARPRAVRLKAPAISQALHLGPPAHQHVTPAPS